MRFVVDEVDIRDAWARGRRRRRLRFVSIAGGAVAAATIGIMVVGSSAMIDRETGEDRFGSTGGEEMTTTTQSPQAECGEPNLNGPSYGTTEIGQWLKDLMIQVGAPQEDQIDSNEVTDTGTALQVNVDADGDELWVYVTAQKPPDPDFSPDAAEPVSQLAGFTIYYQEGSAWKSFTAVNNEWQLSVIAYPGAKAPSVPWTASSTAVEDWFSQALSRAKDDPPPCSVPNH
jgi:hypothetical protein